jgi:hypothetical protein
MLELVIILNERPPVRGARDNLVSGDLSIPLHGLVSRSRDFYCFLVGDGSILPPGKAGFKRETLTSSQPGFLGLGALTKASRQAMFSSIFWRLAAGNGALVRSLNSNAVR